MSANTQLTEPRKCFWIPAESETPKGFIPALVTEGQGYGLLAGNGPFAQPWYWGSTREQAMAVAAAENRKLGLSDQDVADIIMSVFRGASASA